MKKFTILAGAALLAACGTAETEEADVAVAETEAPVEVAPLYESNWTFSRDGADYVESIDADGLYITNEGDAHADHGSYEMVDGKHCFTSAMTDEGQVCWTTPATIEVGDTVEAVSDKGEQLSVTRQEFDMLTM